MNFYETGIDITTTTVWYMFLSWGILIQSTSSPSSLVYLRYILILSYCAHMSISRVVYFLQVFQLKIMYSFLISPVWPDHLVRLDLMILIIFLCRVLQKCMSRDNAISITLHCFYLLYLSSALCNVIVYWRKIRSIFCDWNVISVDFSFLNITRGEWSDLIGTDA